MKSSGVIPLAIAIGGIIIAIAIYVSAPPRTSPPPSSGDVTLVRPVSGSDHILGNPGAKVMIVEYSDFDCEYCKGFSDILHQIITNDGADGEIAWVFREFPLTEVHPNAMKHAEAAECAAKVGGEDAFWKFSNTLFTHQPADPSIYGSLAESVGIPVTAFATCYSNAATTVDARITADRANALEIGAPGAPYSLILVEGQPPVVLYGAYSYTAVKQLVDQALASAGY